EVPGRDLVAERLPRLRDAEGELLPARLLHGDEVHELLLRRLGREVDDARVVLHRAHVGLEHQVELLRLAELGVAAFWADALLEGVLPEPVVAVEAFDQRVGEAGDVTAGLPHLRRHEDRCLEAHDVVAEMHHRAPPRVSDVPSELHTEGAVVPGGAETAVDLAGRKGDAPALAERDDGVHDVGHGRGTSFPAAGGGRWRAGESTGGASRRVPGAAQVPGPADRYRQGAGRLGRRWR